MVRSRAAARQKRRAAKFRWTHNTDNSSIGVETAPPISIGYVNVQGLHQADWERCCQYVTAGRFDVLFIAETWYMGWPGYASWRDTVATTPRPDVSKGSRHSGGICVLAVPAIASRIEAVEVTEAAITLQIGEHRISGVYLPPSMTIAQVSEVLSPLGRSDLVVGDFNTRFGRYPGEGVPRDRVSMISDWLQTARLVQLLPQSQPCPIVDAALYSQLTIDHAFVKEAISNRRLWLIDTRSIPLSTDHRYALCVSWPKPPSSTLDSEIPCRFWTYRLRQKEVCSSLTSYWTQTSLLSIHAKGASVDLQHQILIQRCHEVCEHVLGRVPNRRKDDLSEALRPRIDDLTAMNTHRLMRRAMATDRDNRPLLPTQVGGDALEEVVELFRRRYTGDLRTRPELDSFEQADLLPPPESPFTKATVIAEIQRQPTLKACAADGIHIRILKALIDTSLIDALVDLYNACWDQGTTPQAWNRADICLVVKDKQQPKTPSNVRPITLICLFRKIFEAVFLRVFDQAEESWAHVHPAQAGFRRTYSTLTQAATLHALFQSGLIDSVVFLDFRAAFDVVNHRRLLQELQDRRCPLRMIHLVSSLMCQNVCSRVLANDSISAWFPRTCGVLQGSPLSPCLFNLFVDGLLSRLNQDAKEIPRALFYADDGALLGDGTMDMQQLVDMVQIWSEENGIELNVKKCGYMTTRPDPLTLYIGSEAIPQVQYYLYLGFPIALTLQGGRWRGGIDWGSHLRRRIDAAVRRARFLTLFSASWGPLHRTRGYLQYLESMITYGAPLVYAWLMSDGNARRIWNHTTTGWKELICWISGSGRSWRVAVNLCGLTMLEDRFALLHAAFQYQLDCKGSGRLFDLLWSKHPQVRPFLTALQQSPIYSGWKAGRTPERCTKASLTLYLDSIKQDLLRKASKSRHLTAIVPFSTRQTRQLRYADVVLTAPLPIQELLFRYRLGVFAQGYRHKCAFVDKPFHRGDEECRCFGTLARLSKRRQKERLRISRTLTTNGLFTVVDYWLAVGRLDRAGAILCQVDRCLKQQYSTACFDEGSTSK